jgi:hypothetical protein
MPEPTGPNPAPTPGPPPERASVRVGRVVVRVVAALAAAGAWTIAAVALTVLSDGAPIVAVGLIAAAATTLLLRPRRARWMLASGLTLVVAALVWRGSLTPSNDRRWWEDTSVLPTISSDGDLVTIEGVRNWTWHADGGREPAWETRTYDLTKLVGVDLIVEPFPASELMAHTMLSFDFGDQGWLTLTIEARKEICEDYGALGGALNRFELIYIFADERDAMTVRAVQRGAPLYAYPIRIGLPQEGLRRFFESVCASANALHSEPRFYHIIRDNCTTVWIKHADAVAEVEGAKERLGLQLDTVFNGRITRLFHARGYIDTDLPFAEARERFRVDDEVIEHAEDEDFSALIRAPRRDPGE